MNQQTLQKWQYIDFDSYFCISQIMLTQQPQEYSETWDTLLTELRVANYDQAEELITILDDAKIDRFHMQAAFEQEYQRIEFEYELRLQKEGEQTEVEVSKKPHRRFVNRPVGYQKETYMHLSSNVIKNRIFMKVYQEEINKIQNQNDYRIFCDGSQLRIFMREGYDLNMLCRNKLDEMRNQLSIFIESDQRTLTMFRTSHKLTETLAKAEIYVDLVVLQGRQKGYFYSTVHKLAQIETKVNEIARFNVTIFRFYTQRLTKIQNESLFQLIAESIHDTARKLEENYEIDIQVNNRCQCVVIHKKHACFGVEAEERLKQCLSDLVLLSIKSENVRQFSNRVRKQLQDLPFLKEKIKSSRNESFLAISRNLLTPNGVLNVQHLQQLLRLLKLILQPKLVLKVFFSHLDEQQKEKRKKQIKQLAQEQNLPQVSEAYSENEKKTFKFKDWSQALALKRQQNFFQFIQKLIIPEANQKQLESFVKSFIEQDAEKQSNYSIKVSDSQGQGKDISEISISRGKRMKKSLDWYLEQFKMPPIREIEEEDKAFILAKRQRDLQKLFEQKTKVKCRVSAVELSSRLKWPKQVQPTPLFIRNCFKYGKMSEKWQFCNLQELKHQEQAYLVYLNKELTQEFVPVLFIKRIQ